jgi:hypothetical protein
MEIGKMMSPNHSLEPTPDSISEISKPYLDWSISD